MTYKITLLNQLPKRPLLALILPFCLTLVACTNEGPQKYTERDAGPVSARALNELAKTKPAGLINIARALEQSGNFAEAERVYGQAKAASPDDPRANMGLARLYLQSNRQAEALALLDKLRKRQDISPRLKLELAKVYVEAEAFDTALSLMAVSDGENPAFVTSQRLSMVGIIYELKGNGTEARRYFDLAQTKAKENKATYNSEGFSKLMAYSFALDGNYETAVALLQPVINQQATMKEGRLALAYIYAVSGQSEAALKLIENERGYDYMQERKTLVRLLPHMNRKEKTEVLIFERVKAETMKRLLPKLQAEQ